MKYVEKFGSAGQSTEENITRRIKMPFACLVARARVQTLTIFYTSYC